MTFLLWLNLSIMCSIDSFDIEEKQLWSCYLMEWSSHQ